MHEEPAAAPPLPQPTRPTGTHLYKYGAQVAYLKELILQRMLYIPLVSELNDPADCKPPLLMPTREKAVRFLMRSAFKGRPSATLMERANTLREVQQACAEMGAKRMLKHCVEVLDRHADERRVYSMSKRWDNMAMWAKYASNHRGYCIEFLNDGEDPLFSNTKEVLYDDSIRLDVTDPAHGQTGTWLTMKGPSWAGEEEVRLVIPSERGGPYFTLAPHILTRIILGKDMPEEAVAQIESWASQGTPPISAVRATYSAFERRLVIDPVPDQR